MAHQRGPHIDNRRERLSAKRKELAENPSIDDNAVEAEGFDNSVEVEAEEEARAQASGASDSAGADDDAETANTDMTGRESPMTLGSIDG